LIVRQMFCFSFVFDSGYYSFPITRITGRMQWRRAAAILVAAHTIRFVTTAVAFGAVRFRYQRFSAFDSVALHDRLRIQERLHAPPRGTSGQTRTGLGISLYIHVACRLRFVGCASACWISATIASASVPRVPSSGRTRPVQAFHSPGYFSMQRLAPNFCRERRYHLVFITPPTTSVAYPCVCRKVVETGGLLMGKVIGKQRACGYLPERFAYRAGTG
jgi:hypothetical protein